ncbi:MAG: hypothetical protein HC836_16510 [Richelia sp. RM2_1_2]|nr:hypothetical protein [Richelia sp. RM2_1_2]
MNYIETLKYSSIEYQIENNSFIIISAPIMLIRRKRNGRHIFKGLLSLYVVSQDVKRQLDELSQLNMLYDYASEQLSTKDSIRRYKLLELCQGISTYWWQYNRHNATGRKREIFTFLKKECRVLGNIHNTTLFNSAKSISNFGQNMSSDWGVMDDPEKLSLLRRHKIFTKLFEEYVMVRMTEDF